MACRRLRRGGAGIATPDFLDTEQLSQSLSTWIFSAGEFGASPIKVTIIRFKPAGS